MILIGEKRWRVKKKIYSFRLKAHKRQMEYRGGRYDKYCGNYSFWNHIYHYYDSIIRPVFYWERMGYANGIIWISGHGAYVIHHNYKVELCRHGGQ